MASERLSPGASSRARVYASTCAPEGGLPGHTGPERLAEVVRELRTGYGLSTRRLAERAQVSRSTVIRLEAGTLRPRWSLLNALATGLDPDLRPGQLERMLAAAGADLVPETPRCALRRGRRLAEGMIAGVVPRPVWVERSVRLHVAADSMLDVAAALSGIVRLSDLGRGLRLDERQVRRLLRLADDLRGESELLSASAGNRISVGPAGHYLGPAPRHRGDPVDLPVAHQEA